MKNWPKAVVLVYGGASLALHAIVRAFSDPAKLRGHVTVTRQSDLQGWIETQCWEQRANKSTGVCTCKAIKARLDSEDMGHGYTVHKGLIMVNAPDSYCSVEHRH